MKMKCDFCGEKINSKQDYYEIEIVLHNLADDIEENFDVWIVCDRCFNRITMNEEIIKTIQKRYDELKQILDEKGKFLNEKDTEQYELLGELEALAWVLKLLKGEA
jgi:predicted nicotinamide N-methyase